MECFLTFLITVSILFIAAIIAVTILYHNHEGFRNAWNGNDTFDEDTFNKLLDEYDEDEDIKIEQEDKVKRRKEKRKEKRREKYKSRLK